MFISFNMPTNSRLFIKHMFCQLKSYVYIKLYSHISLGGNLYNLDSGMFHRYHDTFFLNVMPNSMIHIIPHGVWIISKCNLIVKSYDIVLTYTYTIYFYFIVTTMHLHRTIPTTIQVSLIIHNPFNKLRFPNL